MKRLLIIALFASAATAQDADNPLPLKRADGAMCFTDETCTGPWREYVSRADTGWYCETPQRFCWTTGRGESCMCTDGSRAYGWVETGEVSGQYASGVDYDAEIMEHTIDACYLEGLRREGVAAEDEATVLEMVKAINSLAIKESVEAIRAMVAGQPLDVRLDLYRYAVEACMDGLISDAG